MPAKLLNKLLWKKVRDMDMNLVLWIWSTHTRTQTKVLVLTHFFSTRTHAKQSTRTRTQDLCTRPNPASNPVGAWWKTKLPHPFKPSYLALETGILWPWLPPRDERTTAVGSDAAGSTRWWYARPGTARRAWPALGLPPLPADSWRESPASSAWGDWGYWRWRWMRRWLHRLDGVTGETLLA